MTDAPKIDTQALDRAEVEELARQLDRGDQMDGKTVNCKHDACNCALMSDAAEILRALLAERDLSAAREAAAWIAGRDAAADDAERYWEYQPKREGEMMQAIAENIRQLTPPADAAAALDALIAERVREAAKASYDAMCLGVKAIMDAINGGGVDRERHDELKAAADQLADVSFALNSRYDFAPVWLARGSKEGQS